LHPAEADYLGIPSDTCPPATCREICDKAVYHTCARDAKPGDWSLGDCSVEMVPPHRFVR
jgi:hypothetical protein